MNPQEETRLWQRLIDAETKIGVLEKKVSELSASIQGLQSLQGKFLKDLEDTNKRVWALEHKPEPKPVEIKEVKKSWWR